MLELIPKEARFQIKKEGSVENHYIELIACDNPYCDCGESILIQYKESEEEEKEEKGVMVNSNFNDKEIRVEFYEEEPKAYLEECKKMKSYLETHLTDADWYYIEDLHYLQKRVDIEYGPHDDRGYEYYFSYEHLNDDSLQMSFQEIFPSCEIFEVTHEGEHYDVVEQYCKNPECNCTNINLHLFVNREIVADFNYDYASDELKDKEYRWMISKLKSKYKQFKQRLILRNAKIRKVYLGQQIALNELKIKELKGELNQERKVGRNEPCPCGSGKKYKHCCAIT